MKVIHFSASDHGGAGIAAVRYHKLMQEMGISSILYVKDKSLENDDSIIEVKNDNKITHVNFKELIRNKIHNQLVKFIKEPDCYETKSMYCYYNFDECNDSGLIPNLIDKIDINYVDFVFIHWLGGFINSYDLKKIYDATHAKFVFSMMDLETITGGCHYPWNCNKYETNCLDCPAMDYRNNLLSHNQLMTKAANYSYLNADIFSSALYDLNFAKKSIIKFKEYHQLYYPIDEGIFKPAESARNKATDFTLFANVNSVEDPRKGFNYLLTVLINLDKRLARKVRFLCLSNKKYQGYKFNNIYFEEFEFCKNVNDLVGLYQQTDVFLCASIEDSAPMMLQEALLCGVPAVSFDTGVGKQFIQEGRQGYVVPRYDIVSFEEKLYTLIEKRPESIQSAEEIHNHMVKLCGKAAVKGELKKILKL